MSTERGPILRKRGNQTRDGSEPPAEAPPESSPVAGESPSANDARPGPALGAARPARSDRPPRGHDDRAPLPDRRGAPAARRGEPEGDTRRPYGDDRRGPGSARAYDERRGAPAQADGRGRGYGDRASGGGPSSRPQADDRRSGPPVATTRGRAPAGGRDEPARTGAGRRLYDPRAERGQGPAPAPSGVVQTPRDPKGGKRSLGTGLGRPIVRDDRTELKAEAQKLAKDKGILTVHAYRILKGQTTLNDVLKSMMRKERFDQLVQRDGIDRELAGQVASGHLPKPRAVTLTRMRKVRKQKPNIDGIKAAELEKKRVGLAVFGRGWVLGRIRAARPYDFDFLADGADKPDKLFKHDVKAICLAEDIEAVKRACSTDEAIAKLGLVATEDRAQRVRPHDDVMLKFIDDQRVVRFTMRDGEQLLGRLRSFGRWDAELVLDDGETVSIFFHGLHASSLTLGHSA